MVYVIFLVCADAPLAVPVMVMIYEPAANELALFKFITLLLPGVTGLVPNVMVVPTGTPAVADKVIGLVNVPTTFVPNVKLIVLGVGQLETAGAGELNVKPDGGGILATGLSQTPLP